MGIRRSIASGRVPTGARSARDAWSIWWSSGRISGGTVHRDEGLHSIMVGDEWARECSTPNQVATDWPTVASASGRPHGGRGSPRNKVRNTVKAAAAPGRRLLPSHVGPRAGPTARPHHPPRHHGRPGQATDRTAPDHWCAGEQHDLAALIAADNADLMAALGIACAGPAPTAGARSCRPPRVLHRPVLRDHRAGTPAGAQRRLRPSPRAGSA